jgi:hypothetical protein
MLKAIKNNWIALVFAVLAGLIYLAPNLFFIFSLGDKYQGIPMMQTANEDFYIARIQEILDGHPGLGSFALFEGKRGASLTPPAAEMFYALPALLFKVSAVNIVVASRFFLPAILFLLVYFLIRRLTANFASLSNKFNAIAGATLVTLGYDLVDIKNVWLFLSGKIFGGWFLLWSRPVNPIMGAIFLFSFLLCLAVLTQRTKRRWALTILAGIFLALMVGSYFFSWGIALSVLAVLLVVFLLEKRYALAKSLTTVLLSAGVLTSPYWYNSWRLSQSPWYEDMMLRNGLFLTHYPLWNKVLLAALAIYGIIFFWLFLKRKTSNLWKECLLEPNEGFRFQNWFVFCLALLLGGFWALNQQVLTGRTVWPFHFVQYTIPLAMIAVIVLFYNITSGKWPKICRTAITLIISGTLIWGGFVQAKAYISYADYYVSLQEYGPALDWLNRQPNDCVVLVEDETNNLYNLNGLVPAFTHCNVYGSTWAYNLLSPERMHYSYLVLLRMKGVTAETIEDYVGQNRLEAVVHLFPNWKSLYGIKQFPDFVDTKLEERLKKLPDNYRQFVKEDFTSELNKYRLDYVLFLGPPKEEVLKQLPLLKLIWQKENIYIYDFPQS